MVNRSAAADAQRILINNVGDKDLSGSDLRKTSAILMETCLSRHVCPPTALGSRRSGLVFKFICLLHALHLELATWQAVRNFLCRVGEFFTSDMGTKTGLLFVAKEALSTTALCKTFLHFPKFSNNHDSDSEEQDTQQSRLRGVHDDLPSLLRCLSHCLCKTRFTSCKVAPDLTKIFIFYNDWFDLFKVFFNRQQ